MNGRSNGYVFWLFVTTTTVPEFFSRFIKSHQKFTKHSGSSNHALLSENVIVLKVYFNTIVDNSVCCLYQLHGK